MNVPNETRRGVRPAPVYRAKQVIATVVLAVVCTYAVILVCGGWR